MSFTPARLQADGDSGRHRVFRLFLHTHQAPGRKPGVALGVGCAVSLRGSRPCV